MNERTKKIFELLNIKPYESFHIVNNGNVSPCIYFFDKSLNRYCRLEKHNTAWKRTYAEKDLINILNGTSSLQVVNKPTPPTDNDLMVFKYVYLCGYNYIVKDKDGKVYMSKQKPHKEHNEWCFPICEEPKQHCEYLDRELILTDVSCISFNDLEPLCINDYLSKENN